MKPNIICGTAALVLALALLSPPAMAQDKAAAADSAATPAATSSDSIMTAKAEPAATAAKTEAQEVKRGSVHPFAAMAGSWSGGGTISLQGGTRERLRCRAHHIVGDGNKSLGMSIRCASDTYKFELNSNVSEHRGQISGSWSEASNAASGSISGHAAGNHISAIANGDSFTASISVTTNGNRQSVSIVPQGVYITGVQIALSKR